MELPKLQKIQNPATRVKKKKILLLSDDLRMHSGIATMSREIVLQTVHKYDWAQLGSAIKHPDQGKVLDLSADMNKQAKINDAYVKIYAFSGYGNPQVLREIMHIEKPDALMFFTDPRFWGWLVSMEDEIRQQMPMIYYNIWDDAPSPFWNIETYESCNMILNISRQTKELVNNVLVQHDVKVEDVDKLYI